MTTRGGPARSPPVISLVASRPSISGIRTSIRITSGLCSAAAWTAWAPLAASATTVIPSVASRITQNPVLTSSWSSATMTRMGCRSGAGHGAGNRAVTANPPASPGPTVRLPPQDATRSAMPARPNPPDTAGRAPPPSDEPARPRLAWRPRATGTAAFPVSVTDTVT